MRRFRKAPSATTPQPIRRPFILDFDGNIEDSTSAASTDYGSNALGGVAFPSSNTSGRKTGVTGTFPTLPGADPLTRNSRSLNSSVARSQHQQRAAMRVNPALRMPVAKKLAHSQIRRLAKDVNGDVMGGMKSDDEEDVASTRFKAAHLRRVAELRAELREESTEKWIYRRAPSTLSKSLSQPGTVFGRPREAKNAGPKPRPNASFTVEQKRKLKKWFDKLDADGSGEISTEELEDPLLSTGIAHTTADVENLVNEVDKDGSKAIGFSEFLSVLNPGSPDKVILRGGVAGERAKKKKQKKREAAAEEKANPILQLQKMQEEASLSLDTVICAKRRELIIDAVMKEMVKSVRAQHQTEHRYDQARLEHDDDKMEELRLLKEVQAKEINERGEFLDAMRRVVVTSYNTQFAGLDEDGTDEIVEKRAPLEKAAERRRLRQLEDMAAAANRIQEDDEGGGVDWYKNHQFKA